MNVSVKRWLVPAIVVAVIALGWWFTSSRPVTVDTAVLARGPIRSFVEEEGETSVVDRYVLSAPVAGRVLRVEREEGDAVTAGEILAEIDPLQLRARVAEAQAQVRALGHRIAGVDRRRPTEDEINRSKLLEKIVEGQMTAAVHAVASAKADEAQAGREADRARKLRSEGTITAAEEEKAELTEVRARERRTIEEFTLKVREAELEAARLATRVLVNSARDVDWEEAAYREQLAEVKEGLQILEDNFRRARIVSPADGVVLRRYIESETVVAAGAPIMAVGDIARLEVHADLLSGDAARLTPGLTVDVTGRALGDRVLTGRLKTIRPGAFTKISSLGVEQQRVTIVVEFDPAGTTLGDAYRVDVRVILEEKEDVVLVPETALFREAGKWHVFRIEGGRARRVTVETGLRDGRRREAIAGLDAGDEVVLHPGDAITDGGRVSAAKD